jgi:formylglycine-generating enzyme
MSPRQPTLTHLSANAQALFPAVVQIPAGSFAMGSEDGQDVERPVHQVYVDSFLMAETQVTVSEYGIFLQHTKNPAPPFWNDAHFSHPEQPVVAVSWFEAMAYSKWLSSLTGAHFRLPTEAEWERAARGGIEGAAYPWGNGSPLLRNGYDHRWNEGPEPVRRSEANAYGLFEMCENVHEWCSDWFQPDYYSISPDRNPKGPSSGQRRSSRGGSWRHHFKISRCSTRSSIPPQFQYADYGFRLACDLG